MSDGPSDPLEAGVDSVIAQILTAPTIEDLHNAISWSEFRRWRVMLARKRPELAERVLAACKVRRDELMATGVLK